MNTTGIALRYGVFAAIAMIANLAAQRVVLLAHPLGNGFALAVLAGTALGLVIKYMLDKRWIFYDRSTGLRSHSRKFSLYTGVGIITTALFWATETAFWMVGQTEAMREAGAVLGLSAGYALKYSLDKRYVFGNANVRMGDTV